MTLKQESVHLGAFPKQCIKIAGVFLAWVSGVSGGKGERWKPMGRPDTQASVFLNRVLCILAFFCPKQSGLQTLISSSPLPKYWLDKRGMVWEKARKIEGLSQHLCNLLSFSHRHKPLGSSFSTFKTKMVARNYNGNRSVFKTILRKNGQRTMNSIR